MVIKSVALEICSAPTTRDKLACRHSDSDSDMPIAEAMIATSYVRRSNLCWDYTIQQLARLMN